MRHTRYLLPALLLLVLLFSSQPAAACSCVFAPEQDHACVAFPHADAVFSGRVASVSKRNDAEIWGGNYRVFRFEVLEGFSGVEGTTVEVATGMGGGDCGFGFEDGKSYLIYARRLENGTLSTSICSRTRSLERAAADLDHLRRAARGEPGGTLFGLVQHVRRTGMDGHPSWENLKGTRITVESPDGKQISTVSGEDGRFEFRERLSGRYTVRAALSKELPAAAPQEVVVPPGDCVGVVLQASVLGRIQGRVLEADGEPAQSLQLSLIPVRGKPELESAGELYLLEEGRFEERFVPPGDYLLAVNPGGLSIDGSPYPPIFYPAASSPEAAQRITVRPSETVELRDFHLPPPLVERTVSGRVRWHDGQPAAGVRIRLLGPDGEETYRAILTDKAGRFRFEGYEGYRYQLAAEHWDRRSAAHSAPVEVEIAAENEPLDLQIDRPGRVPAPFPSDR